jgi:hypothetical protein
VFAEIADETIITFDSGTQLRGVHLSHLPWIAWPGRDLLREEDVDVALLGRFSAYGRAEQPGGPAQMGEWRSLRAA